MEILAEVGYKPWIDKENIAGGKEWDKLIADAIAECGSYIILLSPNAVNSPRVKEELNFALEEGKRIIPVVIKPVEIPRTLRMRLGTRQRVSLLLAEGSKELVEALRRKKDESEVAHQEENQIKEERRSFGGKLTDGILRQKWTMLGVFFVTLTMFVVYRNITSEPIFESSSFVAVDLELREALRDSLGQHGNFLYSTKVSSVAGEIRLLELQNNLSLSVMKAIQKDSLQKHPSGSVRFYPDFSTEVNIVRLVGSSREAEDAAYLANLYAEEYQRLSHGYVRIIRKASVPYFSITPAINYYLIPWTLLSLIVASAVAMIRGWLSQKNRN